MFLFLGPSGVGKTELARRLAEGLSGSDAGAIRFFRPELLNRVDEMIEFNPLGRDSAERLLARLLARLESDLRDRHGAELSVSAERYRIVWS